MDLYTLRQAQDAAQDAEVHNRHIVSQPSLTIYGVSFEREQENNLGSWTNFDRFMLPGYRRIWDITDSV
jgi:hypothetical protein